MQDFFFLIYCYNKITNREENILYFVSLKEVQKGGNRNFEERILDDSLFIYYNDKLTNKEGKKKLNIFNFAWSVKKDRGGRALISDGENLIA